MSRDEAAYRRFERELTREREAARAVVADVRRLPSAYLGEAVPERWRTLGVVEELSDAARELVEREPEKSNALAEYATVVAGLLDERYPSVLRAQSTARAWKELANAYRYRGEYEAALGALDRADEALEHEFALVEDRAVIAFARATTFRELERFSEAAALLAAAVAVFRELGRSDRVAQCELLRGMIRHRTADRRGARDAYRKAAEAARRVGDTQTVASAYSNLAVLEAEAGRTSKAMDDLQQARAIFEELGATGEVARTTWAVGFVLVRAGRYVEALQPLGEARDAFRSLGMAEEAGLAGVHLGEAYVALRRYNETQELLKGIAADFREAGVNDRALAALDHLRELGAAATRADARRVATYLERLRRDPTLLFLPHEE